MNSTEAKLTITHSPIKAMDLPVGWFEDFPQVGLPRNSSRRRFHCVQSPTAEIFIYECGVPFDSASIKTFKDLLAEPPKIVLPVILQKIKNILGNMSDSTVFKILIATTQIVSGRNVLIIEGRWSNDEDAYVVFMPESAESRFVIELHYQAAKEIFRKNLQAVKTSVASIQWQDN